MTSEALLGIQQHVRELTVNGFIPLVKRVLQAAERYAVPASVILSLLTTSQRTEAIKPLIPHLDDGKNTPITRQVDSPITAVEINQDISPSASVGNESNIPSRPKRILGSASSANSVSEGRVITKATLTDFHGNEVRPGNTYSIVDSGDYPSLLDPNKPANEQKAQLTSIGTQVNDGNVMIAGRVLNQNHGFDIFPVSEILFWTINTDNVAIATIQDIDGNSYNIAASDLLINSPDIDIRGINLQNPNVRSLFWKHPSEFKRAVAETENILSGQSSRYIPVVGLFPVDGEIEKKHIGATDILNKIANHILNIEMNEELLKIVDRIENEGGRTALNMFIKKTLDPSGFANSQLPQFVQGELENFVVIDRDNWGGGGETFPAVTIIGPYGDRERLIKEAERAAQQLSHDTSHEKWHEKIQGSSLNNDGSMVEERDGYNNYEDPQSALTHVTMGLGEVVVAMQLGVDGVYPNNQVIFFADRLIRSGLSPREAVILLTRASAHGDPDGNILTLLNDSRLPGDPQIEDILTRKRSIDGLTMRSETQDDVLQAIADLAGITHAIPSYDPEKDVFSPSNTTPPANPTPLTKTTTLSPVK